MSSKNWLLFGSAVLLVAVVFVFLFFFTRSGEDSPTPPDTEPSFGQAPDVTPGGGTQDVVVIETSGGQTISVPDFIRDRQPFIVASKAFYFITDNQQTKGDAAEFDIVYGTDSSISIGLFKEPLGAVRFAAETELKSLLRLDNATLCTLKVSVAVPNSVNSFYSGKNLGLSFCPGATKLPE